MCQMNKPPLLSDDTEIINSEIRLFDVIQRISKEPRVGFDLETDNYFRYPEHISLIQVSVPGHLYIIDPLIIDDVTPLGHLLADEKIEKIFHSADYDVRSLDREWGFRMCNLFDTSIGAAFVGLGKLGLAAVVKDTLQVTLIKNPKLQRQDWSQRPLNNRSLNYAFDDVRHLLTLREALEDQLQQLGRVAWVKEECRRLTFIRYNKPDNENSFLSIKGNRSLDGRGLAILKTIVAFREKEALRLGRPPFRIIPNMALLEIAATPDVQLNSMKGLGRYTRPPLLDQLQEAIREGMRVEPLTRSQLKRQDTRRSSRAQGSSYSRRLKGLKEWRSLQGNKFGLDPALLWPATSLERLAVTPDSFSDELVSSDVRQWQLEEFGDSLRIELGKVRSL